tara:strand:- start:158 stop:316 length:159 start_codon:yes stop_codon:yes gene_type:complete
VNWYDDELYDVVKRSIEKQKEQLKKQEELIKEQQGLIEQQLENVIFLKREEK